MTQTKDFIQIKHNNHSQSLLVFLFLFNVLCSVLWTFLFFRLFGFFSKLVILSYIWKFLISSLYHPTVLQAFVETLNHILSNQWIQILYFVRLKEFKTLTISSCCSSIKVAHLWPIIEMDIFKNKINKHVQIIILRQP